MLRKKISQNITLKIIYRDIKNKYYRLFYPNDQKFYRKIYKKNQKEEPNFDNPQTYNEKLVWSMLNHRNDLYIQCADKYAVREFVKNRIGEKYLIPMIGLYDKFDSSDLEKLPNSFVLKATHASGWNLICFDKDKLNPKRVIKEIRYWLSRNYVDVNREWLYSYMKPQIICEKNISIKKDIAPLDYKIFCFDGEPKLIQLDIDRFQEHKRNIYTTNWTQLKDFEIAYPQDFSKAYDKPEKLEEMLEIARKLSEGLEHVRVDLYNVSDKIYFGEMTFFNGAGIYDHFKPEKFHLKMGSYFNLPQKNIDHWTFDNKNL